MPLELNFKQPSYAASLEKVVYKDGVTAADFSAFETLQKNVIPGCTCTVDGDLNLLFYTIFGDGSNFMKDWRKAREDFNFNIAAWAMADEKCCGTRMFKCTTNVTETIFKKQTPFNERERFTCWSTGNANFLRVHFSSMTPQVTSGKSFRIESCIEGKEEGGIITLKVYRHIHFMASVVMESIIKKVAASELQISYTKFINLAKTQMKKAFKGKKGQTSPTQQAAVEVEEAEDSNKSETGEDQGVVIAAGVGGLVVVMLMLVFFTRSRKSSPSSPYDVLLDPKLASSFGLQGLDDLKHALLSELGHGHIPIEISTSRIVQILLREGEQVQSLASEAELYVTMCLLLTFASVGILLYASLK